VKTAAVTAAILIFLLSQAVVQAEQQIPTAEQQKIEELIGAVEQLKNAQFVRNGKSYSAASAARFLREKWKARESEVRTAEDFIEKVGSFSLTTGRPYAIRFASGQETPSALFFRSLLAAQAVRQ
jgi:hypothetical protein